MFIFISFIVQSYLVAPVLIPLFTMGFWSLLGRRCSGNCRCWFWSKKLFFSYFDQRNSWSICCFGAGVGGGRVGGGVRGGACIGGASVGAGVRLLKHWSPRKLAPRKVNGPFKIENRWIIEIDAYIRYWASETFVSESILLLITVFGVWSLQVTKQ